MDWAHGIASFRDGAKRYNSGPRHAVVAQPPDPVADPRSADLGVPAVAPLACRLRSDLRPLLRGWAHRLPRWLSRKGPGPDIPARPVPRPDRRPDHGCGGAADAALEPPVEPGSGAR